MASISLRNVSKIYAGAHVAVEGVNLEIGDGEFVVFVGPSGCGKSTLLRMIAGIEEITEGEIAINGNVVNRIAARDRDIAMVFQNYALYPQMTVRENISFALELRKMSREQIGQRVAEAARMLDLRDLLDRKPGQLSGGQRQRVAMGRAIVRHPAAFLLDEPLSNLDAKLRVQLRGALARLRSRLKVTTIHVTHDQIEAMTLGDRVAVFSHGRLQQYDTPHALYQAPDNIFVAGFIGSPAMNFIEARIVERGPQAVVSIGSGCVAVRPRKPDGLPVVGARVALGIRPEHVRLANAAGSEGVAGRVDLIERIEPESYLGVTPLDPDFSILYADDLSRRDANELGGTEPRLLTIRVSADSVPAISDAVQVSIDGSKALLFDIATGAAT